MAKIRPGKKTYDKFLKESATDYPKLADRVLTQISLIAASDSDQSKLFSNRLKKSNADFNRKRIDLDSYDLDSVCDLSLREIVFDYPNVIRQAMIDGSDEERVMLSSLLCKYDLKDNFTLQEHVERLVDRL